MSIKQLEYFIFKNLVRNCSKSFFVKYEFEGKLKVAKINVDDAQELAAAYNVMSIPNMLIFKEGEVLDQMVGAMAKITTHWSDMKANTSILSNSN